MTTTATENRSNYFAWIDVLPTFETHACDLPPQRMQELANQISAPFLDFRPPLLKVRDQPPYFANNWHWTEVGHRAIADYLQNWLNKQVGELSEGATSAEK